MYPPLQRAQTNTDGVQDEVAAAEPSIDEKTAKLVSKGRWSVPGYKVSSYTVFSVNVYILTLSGKIRRSLGTIDARGHRFLCVL